MRYTSKFIILTIASLLFAMSVALLAWRLWPATSNIMKQSALTIERTSWYEISVGGKPLLYFREACGDTLLLGITTNRDSALHHHRMAGCWTSRWALVPSCKGRVVCADHFMPKHLNMVSGAPLLKLLQLSIDKEQRVLSHQQSELAYYLRVHGVQDNGYQQIAALAQKVGKAYDEAVAASHVIDSVARLGDMQLTIGLKSDYVAHYMTDGKMRSTPLALLRTDASQHLLLLQTPNGITPDGVTSVVLLPWRTSLPHRILCVGYGGIAEPELDVRSTTPTISPANVSADGRHDIPLVLAGDGAQVYSVKGIFVGLVSGDTIVGRDALSQLIK